MHSEDAPIFAVPDAPRIPRRDSFAPGVATRCDNTLDFFLSVRFVLPFIVLTMMGTMAGVTMSLLLDNTTESVGDVIVIMQNSVLETLDARVSATLGTLVAENTPLHRRLRCSDSSRPHRTPRAFGQRTSAT